MSAYKFDLRMMYIDDDAAVDPQVIYSTTDPGAMKIAYTAVKEFIEMSGNKDVYLLEAVMNFDEKLEGRK